MISIQGVSDHIVEVTLGQLPGSSSIIFDLHEKEQEHFSDKKISLLIGDVKRGFIVDFEYENNGVWSAKIRQTDKNIEIPWPVLLRHSDYCYRNLEKRINAGCSVVIEVQYCPLTVKVTRLA